MTRVSPILTSVTFGTHIGVAHLMSGVNHLSDSPCQRVDSRFLLRMVMPWGLMTTTIQWNQLSPLARSESNGGGE